MPNQNKTLHPLRKNMLERRLQEIEYLERQQARQDDFSSRMYGKKDYSKERKNIQQELRGSSVFPKLQVGKKFSEQELQAGGRSQLPGTQSPEKRFWEIADEQTAREFYPKTPVSVGKEISRYKHENPEEYAVYLKNGKTTKKPGRK